MQRTNHQSGPVVQCNGRAAVGKSLQYNLKYALGDGAKQYSLINPFEDTKAPVFAHVNLLILHLHSYTLEPCLKDDDAIIFI